MFVGYYIGDNALAAVGAANPILNLLLSLFMGVATGAGIVVAQYFGAKDRKMLSASVGNILFLTIITSVFVSVVGVAAAHPFLVLLQTPDSILSDASAYLVILWPASWAVRSITWVLVFCAVWAIPLCR